MLSSTLKLFPNAIKKSFQFQTLKLKFGLRPFASQKPGDLSKVKKLDAIEEVFNLDEIWPVVVRDLTDYTKKLEDEIAPKWFAKSLEYNRYIGRKSCALPFVMAYKLLAPEHELTDEKMRLIRILGWCFELTNIFFLIVDDLTDNSTIRNDEKCWYRLNDVGLTAVNDALMMENGIFHLLRKYFRDEDYYIDLIHVFHETLFAVATGQLIDMKMAGQDISKFSVVRYNKCVECKTSYIAGSMAVTAARLTGLKDSKVLSQLKFIAVELGRLAQVQNDYFDCFAKGKKGNESTSDIAEGKCTWLAVTALAKANESQKKIMKESYGRREPEKVKYVTDLYKNMKLKADFENYEKDTLKKIGKAIDSLPDARLREIMRFVIQKVRKRDLQNG